MNLSPFFVLRSCNMQNAKSMSSCEPHNVMVLVKSHLLREVSSVLASLQIARCNIALFASSHPRGFARLFSSVSEDPADAAEAALQHAVPHLMLGSRGEMAPFWTFSLASKVPVVIFLDQRSSTDQAVLPRWVRCLQLKPQENQSALIAMNAIVSTLGGGHYLCKHVSKAWALASYQHQIALAMGHFSLAGQCRVHHAYICMQLGKLNEAARRLEREHAFAISTESNDLLAVVVAAQVYLGKLMKSRHVLRQSAQRTLEDDFYRQRFVQQEKYVCQLLLPQCVASMD